MPFASNGSVRIFWRLEGSPDLPVLLLLNAIGTDLHLWDDVVPYLRSHFRILRMDARGHGASDVPSGDYRLEELAQDAVAVMDAARVDRAFVCGLSLGGMVAMTMALQHPRRVAALTLACTSAAMDPEAWRARIATVRSEGMTGIVDASMERFFGAPFRRTRPETVESICATLLGTDPEGYAGCGAAIRDMSLIDRLPKIEAPACLIVGSLDISTPFDGHGDRIAAAVPSARVLTLEAAHLACLEQPTRFAQALISFRNRDDAERSVAAAAQRLFDEGLLNRRRVLGDAWVDASLAKRTAFTHDFQEMITRIAWQEVWGRPGLDQRTRRLLVVAITASLGRWEEFRLHVRSGLSRGGFSVEELKETLMQTAIYAGVPAANTAFAEAAIIIGDTETAAAEGSAALRR